MHEMSTDELDALAKQVAGSGGKWRFDKEHRLLFIDKIVGGIDSQGIHSPRSKRASAKPWKTASWPATKWWISPSLLIDGSYHEVDSSEMAFKIAGSMAFKEACRRASPVLLEPIMKVEVVFPEEYMAQVFGDLNSRRCQIQGTRIARRQPK